MVVVNTKITIPVKSKNGAVTQLQVPAYLAKVPHLLEDIKAGRVENAPFGFTKADDAAFAAVKRKQATRRRSPLVKI